MGRFTPYENFKTLTTNDLQFHSSIRFNQSVPGMPVSKITFHAHPCQTGLHPCPPWKVQAFPRTFRAAPHHTTFCALLAWNVILITPSGLHVFTKPVGCCSPEPSRFARPHRWGAVFPLFTQFVHQKPFSCTNCKFSPGSYTRSPSPVQNKQPEP